MKQKKNIEQYFKDKFKNFEVKPPKNSWFDVLRKLGKKNKSATNQNIERVFQEKFKDFEVMPPENSWNEIQHKLTSKNKSKSIERIFQEHFKNFEATPPKNSWNEIQNRLKQNKHKKRVIIPLWTRYANLAAVLLLGFFMFKNNFDDPNNASDFDIVDNLNTKTNDTIDNTKSKTTTKDDFNNSVVNNSNNNQIEITTKDDFSNSIIDNSDINNNTRSKITTKDNFNNSVVNNSDNNQTEITTKDDFNNSVVNNSNNNQTEITTKDDFSNSVVNNSNNNQIEITTKDDFSNSMADNSNVENKKQNKLNTPPNKSDNQSNKINDDKNNFADNQQNNFIPTEELEKEDKNTIKKDLLEEIKLVQNQEDQENQQDKILLNPKSFNKWRITPTAGAITMNSLSDGSPISDKFTENSKDYQTSMSYGLGLDYSLTKKFSVRTGINKLTTAYNTNNIVVYVSADRIEVLQNAMNIETATKDIVVTAKSPLSTNDSKTDGYINQKMGYIEIPLELSYKLLENKFGIEIIGGVSTLFLQENEVSVLSNQMKTTLGKANNLSQTHFSTNIGVGFRYEIFKSFDINLDPMFKYQLGTFDKNKGNFNPYLFGVYTGLSFKF